MDFPCSFTEEQTLLRDSLASYLADHSDFDKPPRCDQVHAAGWRPEVWKAFAEELPRHPGRVLPREDMGGLWGRGRSTTWW